MIMRIKPGRQAAGPMIAVRFWPLRGGQAFVISKKIGHARGYKRRRRIKMQFLDFRGWTLYNSFFSCNLYLVYDSVGGVVGL